MSKMDLIKAMIDELSDAQRQELITYLSKKHTYRRNTLEQEERLISHQSKFDPLQATSEPDFEKNIDSFLFLKPDKTVINFFKTHLSTVERFDKTIQILERGVVINDFVSVESCNSLMNVFLQTAEIKNSGNILEDFKELMYIWGGQALSFKISHSNVMIPHESEYPSEVAFYKLEKKHNIFKTFAEELGVIFKQIFNVSKLNVSLSMRYLVENMGGNPIHVDAWEDSTFKNGTIYTNQQFSLFLHAKPNEKFVVFNTDGTQTTQQGVGSLMGFNPTLKHHHPTGYGSWIMIIEAIIQNKK